jgi:serine/threonine-protein kinase
VAPANPEKIGRYQVIERVGRGGMGVLFRGVDPVLDREVAIKLMLVDFSEDEEQMRPRFYREARAAAKLQHRNIVTVFEFAEEGSTPYIVMEFLRGVSLAARLTSPLPLTLDTKLDIVAQLCTALHYAHEQGVVHRDVKPANVFILNDGTVKLLDFGIAKVTTSTLTRKGDVLGSASYMSPEQVSGSDDVDGRSDIFSTGVVLYELLAGRKPFHAEAPTAVIMKLLHEPPTPLDQLVTGLPAQLVATVNRALAKDPAERFATAGELAKELEWIRKALETSGDGSAVLDETRFASPSEIKRFQTDASAKSPTQVPVAQAAGRKWLLAAAIGAFMLVGVAVYVTISRSAAEQPGPAATAAAAGASAPRAATGSGAGAAPATGAGAADEIRVAVASDPAGATIAIDGKETTQTTPATVAMVAGPHRLKLSKKGFVAQDVRLAEADVRGGSLSYTLQPATVASVAVSITSTYPVAVLNGSKAISSANESHQLTVPAGSTLHVTASEYLLDAVIKAEGKQVDYQAPALGFLNVLTKYETCNVKIGEKDLGYPPITKLPIAAGQHRVDISCPTGQNPPGQMVTVTPNGTATARIQ